MELAGGLASISQLAHYGLSSASILLELYKSISQGPEFVRQYRHNIEQLRVIVDLISCNQLLQSESIEDILVSINTEASSLQSILGQTRTACIGKKLERLKITWTIFVREQRIKDVFTSLEKKKSTLVLYIGEKNTKLLGSICSGLASLSGSILEVQELSGKVQLTIDSLSEEISSSEEDTKKLSQAKSSPNAISSIAKSKTTNTLAIKHSDTLVGDVSKQTNQIEMADNSKSEKSQGRKYRCTNNDAQNSVQLAGSSYAPLEGDDFECTNKKAKDSVQAAGAIDKDLIEKPSESNRKKSLVVTRSSKKLDYLNSSTA